MNGTAPMDSPFDPTADPAWCLVHDGYDKLREGSVASRFAISNGLLGVRGGRATTRGERWVVPARTYVAGLFDRVGAPDDPPGLVPAADWQKIRVTLPSGPLVHHPGEVKSHRMTLDMRRGALLGESHVQAETLSVRVRSLRLVSLSERAVGLQLIRFEIDHGSVDITLQALFEGLELGLLADRIEPDLGVWHTPHSGMTLAIATAASLRIDGRELPPAATGPLQASWSWTTRPGQIVSFERQVAFVRIRHHDAQAGTKARDILHAERGTGGRGVMTAHTAAWAARWVCSDVAVDGDPEVQRALRFAIYHLNGAADPTDERVSIGARALTGDRAWLMTKLEKPQALDNLDAILALSDAVMVARGDLGVELPPEEVPLAQKRIVRAARALGRPVVVATQMLESMIAAPSPTRAEASDVATAVFDGADAVMLSAETAAGQYPYEAVNMMDRIVARVERDEGWRAITEAGRPVPEHSAPDAIAAAARQVAQTIGAQVIVAFTESGSTALRLGRERPHCPILTLTPDIDTARRLAVVWGVHAQTVPALHTMTEAVAKAVRVARAEGFAKLGQEVVVAAGVPFGQKGSTNALRVATVK